MALKANGDGCGLSHVGRHLFWGGCDFQPPDLGICGKHAYAAVLANSHIPLNLRGADFHERHGALQ